MILNRFLLNESENDVDHIQAFVA